MMNDALEDELVDRNPFANLGLAQSRGRKDIISLTEEELYLLADIARTHGPWLEAFVLFQGFQGLRPWVCTAEIRPEHIAGDELRLVHPGKRVPPRTVLLLPEAAAAIDRLEPEAGGYLFTTPRGNRIAQANVGTYWWNKIRYVFESKLDPRRAAELRDARPDLGAIDPYELRHTAITLMLRRGLTPEQVAWQVGHTDEGYEVRTRYGHPTDADRMDAVRKELAHA
jgi:integrase